MVDRPVHFKFYCTSVIKRFQFHIILFTLLIIRYDKIQDMAIIELNMKFIAVTNKPKNKKEVITLLHINSSC